MSDDWFEVTGLDVLQRCPPDVDADAWDDFIRFYRMAEARQPVPHPVQLDVELNGGCNMACPFCIHGYESIPNAQLDTALYKRLINEAVEFGVRSLKLNYINEPLMRRDLEDLIRYARDAGILNVYFVTNGLLLTERRRARLLDSGLTKLFCSIDAATAETYDKQRTSGRFDAVVANIRAFIAERNARDRAFPQVCVSFLRNSINEHEQEQFHAQWYGVADAINFQTMNEVPGHETGLTLAAESFAPGCKFPFKQLVVNHKGEILPCCKLAGPELAVGHASTTTLREAWRLTQPLRVMHGIDHAWSRHSVCSKCMRCEA